jgi:hypothetical protein
MAYSRVRTVAFLGELIALENRLSRGYGDEQRSSPADAGKALRDPTPRNPGKT